MKTFQKISALIFVFVLFFFASSRINPVRAIVVCNPASPTACTSNQGCSCPESAFDWKTGVCSVQYRCVDKQSNQQNCGHTICPVNYHCVTPCKGQTYCSPGGGAAVDQSGNCAGSGEIGVGTVGAYTDAGVYCKCGLNSSGTCKLCNPNTSSVTCPAGTSKMCGSPAVIQCVLNYLYKCPFPGIFTGWQTGDAGKSCAQTYPGQSGKAFCRTNCGCCAIGQHYENGYGCVSPPNPTEAATPTPTPRPALICQQMSEYVGSVDVTSNTALIKYGDTVLFNAKANNNGQSVKSMTFELLTNGVSVETKVVTAVLSSGVWNAPYTHTFNSYGTHRVRVTAVTPL